MNWLTILKAVLSLANVLAKYVHDKQLLDAGEYKVIARNNEEAILAIKAAQEARSNVRWADIDSLPDDPENRDNKP